MRDDVPQFTDIPDFHGEAALAGWQRVIREVHAVGGKMGPQLWHVGGTVPGTARNVGMTEEDIAETIATYARAAADARRLGFDNGSRRTTSRASRRYPRKWNSG